MIQEDLTPRRKDARIDKSPPVHRAATNHSPPVSGGESKGGHPNLPHRAVVDCRTLPPLRSRGGVRGGQNLGVSASPREKIFAVELRPDWCKGCYLCIDVCPVEGIFTKESAIGPKGFQPVAVNPKGCTGCNLCELLCPDLAITVTEE